MILIYDYNNSILHFSYCNKDETSPYRGILIKSFEKICFENNVFCLVLNLKLKNSIFIPDFRYYLKNKFFKLVILYFFVFIYKIYLFCNFISLKLSKINYKNKKIMNHFVIIIILLICLFRFIICGFYVDKNKNEEKLNISLLDWRKIIFQMPINKSIEVNKFFYFESNFPIIKGIHDFYVLPIQLENLNKDYPDRYIAVSFKEIISMDKKLNLIKLSNKFSCLNENKDSYFIFLIHKNIDILLFEKKSQVSNIQKFILVPQSNFIDKANLKNICNYIPLI
ncbi:hypothetical protein GCL60_00510 [Silvanigrella paludirubra]|uniref:Uncharacterized protein n=1 Tax=Silvanigrella paludirubra TaxID=2499159 RepID=A0A6N6VV19_9BACT|nr:hypothetical protein [Silvanigrella paludirubra]KAB8040430.1 hypothetical protein GCL60_00510 [Silvanigrella paludirubra]